jgi:AraC family transcriptional regulator
MKTLTRETYSKRIEAVLDFIQEHLHQELDLHRLAEEAFLSPYHFHRVYVAMMGETVAETIRRRRLHGAAVKLLASKVAITRLASESGYGSAQAFGRAFRETYGVGPAQYRLHGELSHALHAARAERLEATDSRHAASQQARPYGAHDRFTLLERSMYQIKDVIVQIQTPIPVLALQHLGDYQAIGASFERLMVWAAGRGLSEQAMRSYAIYYDDPISKPKEQLLSEACLSLPERVDIAALVQGDIRAVTIPGSRCATFLFKGPYSDLERPYRWLYDTWLPASGEEVGQNPPYEEYLNDARTTPPAELLTRICIPLND